jgi:p-hydroxybenzoate 3-monooxygenase
MAKAERTQVGIVGAGPAGLLLGHLLHREGIDSVILEDRSRAYIEGRIRAGVIEQGAADLLREAGLGARMDREGLVHHGIELRFNGEGHRIDLSGLTGGKVVTVYGQHELVKDMAAARLATGRPLLFEAQDVRPIDLHGPAPRLLYRKDGEPHELVCDVIAGCDGFHGVCRAAIPPERLTLYERVYPFAWLGILVQAPPASDELIYAYQENGFALFSMRSHEVTRLYIQVPPETDIAAWPEERIWEELHIRLADHRGWRPNIGPLLQKGITGMRSFVAEPMRYGRLFLAGDAAHIVPPTGAKGMNLAIADVRVLAEALTAFFREESETLLDAYSATCLRRIWKAQRFSWWMTSMLHRWHDASAFDHRRQLAELDYVTASRAAATSLAENYVGLPFEM